MYTPGNPPNGLEWARDELIRLRDSLDVYEFVRLVPTANAPAKPRDGEVRFANGTTWNPGSGAGVYAFYGSTWNKLG